MKWIDIEKCSIKQGVIYFVSDGKNESLSKIIDINSAANNPQNWQECRIIGFSEGIHNLHKMDKIIKVCEWNPYYYS